MTFSSICGLVASLGVACAVRADATPTTAPATGKPNIILILADDVGLGNIGCFGGARFQTPNIDALAQSGLKFNRAYSTPLCGPSRCQILTGQYPFRTGLISNQSANAISPKKQIMIPTVMKQAGYVTGSCGKWGQMCLGPKEWGFDEWLVFPGSGKYWSTQPGGFDVNGKTRELKSDEYLPDVMHGFVADFLSKHHDQPFFLYYPMSSIHGPILKTPDSKPGSDLYADNIAYMDKLVGQLVAELDRQHLRENTLVIYAGDNGTATVAQGVEKSPVNGQSISGHKGSMWEGGSRVPFIASWPGKIAAGKSTDDFVDFSDFFVTFTQIGGATLPADRKYDGVSFLPRLLGQPGQARQWVYVELGGKRYVRDEGYKFTNAGVLYDMSQAPFKETEITRDNTTPATEAEREKLKRILFDLTGDNATSTVTDMEKPAKPKANAERKAAKKAAKKKAIK